MKKIELGNHLFAMVDDDDFDKVKEYNWKASFSGNRYYARVFFREPNEKKISSFMLQSLIIGKAPKGKRLLFIDGNSLNCQKENLEFISNSIAGHRYYKLKKDKRNTKRPYRGVTVQYIAKIKFKGKILSLGYFDSEEAAANAYNIKAAEIFGDRAVLNVFQDMP